MIIVGLNDEIHKNLNTVQVGTVDCDLKRTAGWTDGQRHCSEIGIENQMVPTLKNKLHTIV